MSSRNTDYAKWITLDDSESVSIDVHPDDRPELASCLLMFGLHFRCEERDSGDEELTFGSGTTVDQVHVAVTEFDRLRRQGLDCSRKATRRCVRRKVHTRPSDGDKPEAGIGRTTVA